MSRLDGSMVHEARLRASPARTFFLAQPFHTTGPPNGPHRCALRDNSGNRQGNPGSKDVPAWPWQAERETDLRCAKARGATVLAHRLRL